MVSASAQCLSHNFTVVHQSRLRHPTAYAAARPCRRSRPCRRLGPRAAPSNCLVAIDDNLRLAQIGKAASQFHARAVRLRRPDSRCVTTATSAIAPMTRPIAGNSVRSHSSLRAEHANHAAARRLSRRSQASSQCIGRIGRIDQHGKILAAHDAFHAARQADRPLPSPRAIVVSSMP